MIAPEVGNVLIRLRTLYFCPEFNLSFVLKESEMMFITTHEDELLLFCYNDKPSVF